MTAVPPGTAVFRSHRESGMQYILFKHDWKICAARACGAAALAAFASAAWAAPEAAAPAPVAPTAVAPTAIATTAVAPVQAVTRQSPQARPAGEPIAQAQDAPVRATA